jgi:hypothetical protein
LLKLINPGGDIYEVSLDEGGFNPSELVVQKGDRVKFTTSLNR